jgi:hypothetical protein
MCVFFHLRIALHVSISRTQVCAAPEKILAERTPTQVLRYHSVLIKLLGSLITVWLPSAQERTHNSQTQHINNFSVLAITNNT